MLTVTDAGRRIGGVWIWRHLDLQLRAGERLALVGPSGSGKTLLLRSIAGLDALDEGNVALEGRPLDEWEMPEYRARVMCLPQDAALVEGTVELNLRLPFDFEVHADRAFERRRALELLENLGRDAAFLDKRSRDLSGGERQITALLRALMLDPEVLLLDEPAASMDEALARGVEALVGAWMESPDGDRAVLWTSHQARRLERVADRTVEL